MHAIMLAKSENLILIFVFDRYKPVNQCSHILNGGTMSEHYKLCGRCWQGFPAQAKFNFPLTGGTLGAPKVSVHSPRAILDVQIAGGC